MLFLTMNMIDVTTGRVGGKEEQPDRRKKEEIKKEK